jgi:hypothetical protein
MAARSAFKVSIGNPELPYVQIPLDQAKGIFLGNSFSEHFVENLLGMAVAIKSGFMNYQPRDASTTTKTTAEEFVSTVYLKAYQN